LMALGNTAAKPYMMVSLKKRFRLLKA